MDIIFAHAQTAINTKQGAAIYRSTLFDIRTILKSYVDGNKKTIKVPLNDKTSLFAKINFKTVSSLSADALNTMLHEFCEEHPYQVNSLENLFANCLINIKATNKRTAVKTSSDIDNDDIYEYNH